MIDELIAHLSDPRSAKFQFAASALQTLGWLDMLRTLTPDQIEAIQRHAACALNTTRAGGVTALLDILHSYHHPIGDLVRLGLRQGSLTYQDSYWLKKWGFEPTLDLPVGETG